MGNVVDFRRCESLNRHRQELTDVERAQLTALLRAVTSRPASTERTER